MRILLDECVDERLRLSISLHECQTARFAGFAGLKNGASLTAAEAAGFEVLLTVDRHMPDQQTFVNRRIALLIIRSKTSRLADLKELVPDILVAVVSVGPGQMVTVGS